MSCLLVCYAGNLVAIKECLRFIDFILVQSNTHTRTHAYAHPSHMQQHTRAFIDQALCINFMPESMQQSRSVCGFEVNVMISICQQHPQFPTVPSHLSTSPRIAAQTKNTKCGSLFRFHPDASGVLWGKERATGRRGMAEFVLICPVDA